ncbi:MAG: helix-turn-helix domain-containing protein [Clostridiaceae bacterium]
MVNLVYQFFYSLDTLEKNRWNITKSANELGIIRQSLDYRMKKLNIEK